MENIAFMSAKERSMQDRRVVRTRQAVVKAVTGLIFSSGVASVSMATVAEAANVGRSTLYEHFRNKDELLAASIAPLFDKLAAACVDTNDNDDSSNLHALVAHFWAGRAFAPSMLQGRTGQVVGEVLIESFECALTARDRSNNSRISPTRRRLPATYLARGTVGVLLDWLTGRVSGSASEIATILRAFAEIT
jgi:AcrR family transcriptional regulator